MDEETGLLRLDRALHSAVYYLADYGFIPRTYCDDGDPLVALVLGQEPVYPLTIVQARAIGVMRMRDEKVIDDKIVAVSVQSASTIPPSLNTPTKTNFQRTFSAKCTGSSRTTRRWGDFGHRTSRSGGRLICKAPMREPTLNSTEEVP